MRVVAFAASAGGLAALSQVLSALPPAFAATVLVVQHLHPRHRSLMSEFLQRRIRLSIHEAKAGDRLAVGTVLIAPPDRHLLVDATGVVTLSDAARVLYVRPSANLLFESLAESFGPRVIAVVLTGSGADGAQGVLAVKRHGGTVIVQDEASSQFFGMPGAAIDTGTADRVLPLDEIAGALTELVGQGGRA